MRILVLADVHSNWPALRAIEEPFDACVMVGDLVDYGTDPVPCIEWARTHAIAGVRGNHDHAVAQHVAPRPGGGYRRLALGTRPWHWEVLGESTMDYLDSLPTTRYIELDGLRLFLVHATPRDALDEYVADDPATWADRVKGIDADIICVGHTHIPFHLDIDGKQILNSGSVGQPRDGDPRASYAIIDDGRVELRRVEYPIDETLEQMRQTNVETWVVELSERLLRSGGQLSREEMDACGSDVDGPLPAE